MTPILTVGVLGFHGDVSEHIHATQTAAQNLKLKIQVIEVRTKKDIQKIQALIIPGGESTVLHKLSQREGIFELIKNIPYIFGTCAGAIMLSNDVLNKTQDQKTLELMDIKVDRNAYGRQTESFEQIINTQIGKLSAVFIRAPKILSVGKGVKVLAKSSKDIIGCEQIKNKHYYLALTFHPELTTTKFHEYFLQKNIKNCIDRASKV